MFRRWTQWLLVVLLIVSVGGHWTFLQGVAWATMLARFSRAMPVAQAVEYTFDGRHPCPLCKAIKQGKTAEQESGRQEGAASPKLEPGLPAEPAVILPLNHAPRMAVAQARASTRTDDPPKPRPRAA